MTHDLAVEFSRISFLAEYSRDGVATARGVEARVFAFQSVYGLLIGVKGLYLGVYYCLKSI